MKYTKHPLLSLLSICLSAAVLQSCSHSTGLQETVRNQPVVGEAPLPGGETPVLSGEWEYEEGGMVVPLRLDRFGNGSYEFKDGRFRIDLFSDHRWAGAWAQRENDREGGFEITLSPDYSEGEGRWWYTRIERDTAPTKPGGRFHVVKVQSVVGNHPVPGGQAAH